MYPSLTRRSSTCSKGTLKHHREVGLGGCPRVVTGNDQHGNGPAMWEHLHLGLFRIRDGSGAFP